MCSPKYVLSGLLKCGECGANFVIVGAGRYGCASHKNRGPAVCKVSISVKREVVESKILEAIRERLLNEDAVRVFVNTYVHMLKNSSLDVNQEQERVKSQQQRIDGEIANIMAAIKAGIITDSTKLALESAEAEKKALENERKALAGRTNVANMNASSLEKRFKEMLNDMNKSFASNPERARQLLAMLVGQEICSTPQ